MDDFIEQSIPNVNWSQPSESQQISLALKLVYFYWTVPFKYINSIICQLYLNDVD